MAREGLGPRRHDEAIKWREPLDDAVLASAPLVAARRILGVEVVDAHGQFVGWLHDLVLDAELGVVAYAVVGCAIGGSPKRFAVPWNTLRRELVSGCFVWNVERETLERAPGLPADFTAGGNDRVP